MAEQLSDRELRLRKREQVREETERREMDELERKRMELEMLRESIDQRRSQMNRLRETQTETGYDFDNEGSYMEIEGNRSRIYDIPDFQEHDILHNSTGISENFEYNEQSLRDELDEGLQTLQSSFSLERETGIKQTETYRDQAKITERDTTVDRMIKEQYDSNRNRIIREYSEGARRKVSRLDTRSNHKEDEKLIDSTRPKTVVGDDIYQKDIVKRDRDESLDRLKEQIEAEMKKEMLLKNEMERQKLKEEERRKLVKTLEELRMKNRETERNIRESEKRRTEIDVTLQVEKANQEYESLLKLKRDEELRLKQKIAQETVKKERQNEEEEMLLKEKIRREVEEKMYGELEMRSKEKKDIERKRIEKLEKRKAEELDLLRSIEKLRLKEKELKESHENEVKDINEEDEEVRRMEIKLTRLRKEKEMLEEKLRKDGNKLKATETVDQTPKDSQKLDKAFGKPKLPEFDGTQFEEWKLEVVSLKESKLYTDLILSRAVRNTLTGKARKVLLTLKPTASTDELMKKLEDIFGNIRSGDSIIHDFYSAKQTKTESCSEWGVRIETFFYQALEREEIEESKKDSKLKERFWRGLHSEQLKMATRSAYESKESFDTLRRKARIEELEMEITKNENTNIETKDIKRPEETKVCQTIQKTTDTQDKLDKLLQKMKALESEIREIRTQQSRSEYRSDARYFRPYRGGRRFGQRGRGYGYNQDGENNRDERRSDKTEDKKKDAPNDQNRPSEKDKKVEAPLN